jgi:hypothetical protein
VFTIRFVAVAAVLVLLNVLQPATAQSSAQNARVGRSSVAERSQMLVRDVIARYLALSHKRRSRNGVSWISPELAKTKELVYVSSAYALNIYSPSGKSLGVITAPSTGDFGDGVAVDASENVYVDGDTSSFHRAIFEYARGATQPKRIIVLGNGRFDFAMGIAAGADGTVYAARPDDNDVVAIAPGATIPTRTLSIPPGAGAGPFSLTVDSKGTVVVLMPGSVSAAAAIVEYPHGKSPGFVGPYDVQGGIGIAADGSNHLVVSTGGYEQSLYVLLRNDPFWLQIGGASAAGFLAFNRRSDRLFYATIEDYGLPGEVQFPSLNQVRAFQLTDSAGIAVSPAVNV